MRELQETRKEAGVQKGPLGPRKSSTPPKMAGSPGGVQGAVHNGQEAQRAEEAS